VIETCEIILREPIHQQYEEEEVTKIRDSFQPCPHALLTFWFMIFDCGEDRRFNHSK